MSQYNTDPVQHYVNEHYVAKFKGINRFYMTSKFITGFSCVGIKEDFASAFDSTKHFASVKHFEKNLGFPQ